MNVCNSLAILDGEHRSAAFAELLAGLNDRRFRYRVKSLVENAPDADHWAQWLRNRAVRRRVWVHPGVEARFAEDERLRPAGSYAAAVAGFGIHAGEPKRFYIDECDLDQVIREYKGRLDDRQGEIELMVIPSDVPDELKPPVASPVPLGVALVDLMESEDARERSAGFSFAEVIPDHVREHVSAV